MYISQKSRVVLALKSVCVRMMFDIEIFTYVMLGFKKPSYSFSKACGRSK